MQDIIDKIDQRVTTLLIFERYELIPASGVLAAVLALHEDTALALRRIDGWQQALELWLKTTGLSSLHQGDVQFLPKLVRSQGSNSEGSGH
jgi:hypothetical protein